MKKSNIKVTDQEIKEQKFSRGKLINDIHDLDSGGGLLTKKIKVLYSNYGTRSRMAQNTMKDLNDISKGLAGEGVLSGRFYKYARKKLIMGKLRRLGNRPIVKDIPDDILRSSNNFVSAQKDKHIVALTNSNKHDIKSSAVSVTKLNTVISALGINKTRFAGSGAGSINNFASSNNNLPPKLH